MQYKIKTEKGNITIDKAAIGAIVVKEAEQFEGKVIISNYKNNPLISKKKTYLNDVNSIEVSFSEDSMDLKIFLMVKFGTSIGKVTNKLIEDVYNSIKETIGLEPNSISVVITGMISKNVAKRNIEVRR